MFYFFAVLISCRVIYVCQRTWVIAIMILKPKNVVLLTIMIRMQGKITTMAPFGWGCKVLGFNLSCNPGVPARA